MATTKVTNSVVDFNATGSTKSLKLPSGNAFSGTPEEGMIRNDNSGPDTVMQFYNGTAWINLGNSEPTTGWVVVGGGTNDVVYSSDGVTWKAATAPSIFSTAEFVAVGKDGSGNRRWIAAGGGNNTIAVSSDGIAWSGIGSPGPTTEGSCVSYTEDASGNPLWLSGGRDPNPVFGSIYASSNGTSWTRRTSGTFLQHGGAVNGVFEIARGEDGSGNPLWVATGANRIGTSTDSITWTMNSYQFSIQARTVAYGEDGSGNGLWVVGGYDSTNSIATSSNGTTYTGRGKPVITTVVNCVTWGEDGSGNGLWVAGGGSSGDVLMKSSDGINWTAITFSGFNGGVNFIAWNGSLWVAVGEGSGTGNESIATSSDGTNWTSIAGSSTLMATAYGVASFPAPELYPPQT